MRISDWSSDVCSSDLFADRYFLLAIHSDSPINLSENGSTEPIPGQDSKETRSQALLGSHGIGEVKPRRQEVPGNRQVRGKTRIVDQSAGQEDRKSQRTKSTTGRDRKSGGEGKRGKY